MTFRDTDIQLHYERVISLKIGGVSEEERPVLALMDAYGWFRLTEGEESPKVREIIEHLLSPELRPGLRTWYRRFNCEGVNSPFTEFRDRLSQLAGERLGD